MHRKYAKDGVVCMSVSLDEKVDKELALKFLRAQRATFPNYLLDEEIEAWQEQLKIAGPPMVFVYDRDGQRVARFGDKGFTYADVEKVVRQLLDRKK
jgi:hypothetical protein